MQERYTLDQVATASRELRAAAGADDELLEAGQVISTLAREIQLLRERGFTDDRIASLLVGFDIHVTGAQISEEIPPSFER
ncbi:MAG: hypothetical protein HIU91_07230 [Acidobacteria bacterium]|nr:hypothetical protein [Acidobacteriota bacterium]